VTGIEKIKVLIVDDSALVRKILTTEIGKDSAIEIIGTAPDPYIARDKIVKLNPDVILLDIEMPRMDGLTFLRKLMKSYPCRVIIVSSLAKKNSETALKAVEYGALGVIAKPGVAYSVQDMSEEVIEKIKQVSAVPLSKLQFKDTSVQKTHSEKLTKETESPYVFNATNKIIAMGASTGGTEALKTVLLEMPINMPPVVIVQHMPQFFTKSFADRLDEICAIKVKEAEDMDILAPGKALIAPGNKHIEIRTSGSIYYAKVLDGPRVNHQKPSVDTLFNSVAKYAGKNAIGVILTGMGKDGADGMQNMKEAGTFTIAQDEESCIVFGMPKEAISRGCIDTVVPIDKIASTILENI
jgi:two-component system, chemotaxis family, protein-glutamate methylesterase/glutaminase